MNQPHPPSSHPPAHSRLPLPPPHPPQPIIIIIRHQQLAACPISVAGPARGNHWLVLHHHHHHHHLLPPSPLHWWDRPIWDLTMMMMMGALPGFGMSGGYPLTSPPLQPEIGQDRKRKMWTMGDGVKPSPGSHALSLMLTHTRTHTWPISTTTKVLSVCN